MADRDMPRVLVWLTEGGIVEHIVEGDVELEVVDFQNLAAGDVAPEFSPEMLGLAKKRVPDLVAQLDAYRARYECQDCGKPFWDAGALEEIDDLHQRVAPGEPMPAGQCPACGALVAVVPRAPWITQQT